MANQKEYNEPFSEEEQNEDDPKEDETVDPSNDEPDEFSDTGESQEEGTDSSEKSDSSLPKRGARFRKQLLKKIPVIEYPDTLETKELALDSWLGTVINLKAFDYLETLQKLVSKKNL